MAHPCAGCHNEHNCIRDCYAYRQFRREMRRVNAPTHPESNDLNVGYQAGQQDSEAWKLLENIVSATEGIFQSELTEAIAAARDALERRK